MTTQITLEKEQAEKILDLLERAEYNLPDTNTLTIDYRQQCNSLRELLKQI